jgi:hypothetical protein
MTPIGELAPTGKFLRWQAVEFVRVRHGRIASWCSYFDQLSVLLGLSMSVSITAAPHRTGSPVLDLGSAPAA